MSKNSLLNTNSPDIKRMYYDLNNTLIDYQNEELITEEHRILRSEPS